MADREKSEVANLSSWRANLIAISKYLSIKLMFKFLGKALFTFLGLFFVALAAMLISVIQFQSRIIEAKNQSKNFSLTALTQSVAMQEQFVQAVDRVQSDQDRIAQYQNYKKMYLVQSNMLANAACEHSTNVGECVSTIIDVLPAEREYRDYVRHVIIEYAGNDVMHRSNTINVDNALKNLADVRRNLDMAIDEVKKAQLACDTIKVYARYLHADDSRFDSASFIYSFAPQYVMSARSQCEFSFAEGAYKNEKDENKSENQVERPRNSTLNFQADVGGVLLFDLMSYYQFYEHLFSWLGFKGFYWTAQIVIAPIDITIIALVIACGALGAMLRITVERYNPQVFGKEHAGPKVSLVYYFIIGIMCSLIVYILAKTALAGVSEETLSSKTNNLSPFVTAFLAIVSGLLSEEAFKQIIGAGRKLLGRSGIGSDATKAIGKSSSSH